MPKICFRHLPKRDISTPQFLADKALQFYCQGLLNEGANQRISITVTGGL